MYLFIWIIMANDIFNLNIINRSFNLNGCINKFVKSAMIWIKYGHFECGNPFTKLSFHLFIFWISIRNYNYCFPIIRLDSCSSFYFRMVKMNVNSCHLDNNFCSLMMMISSLFALDCNSKTNVDYRSVRSRGP